MRSTSLLGFFNTCKTLISDVIVSSPVSLVLRDRLYSPLVKGIFVTSHYISAIIQPFQYILNGLVGESDILPDFETAVYNHGRERDSMLSDEFEHDIFALPRWHTTSFVSTHVICTEFDTLSSIDIVLLFNIRNLPYRRKALSNSLLNPCLTTVTGYHTGAKVSGTVLLHGPGDGRDPTTMQNNARNRVKSPDATDSTDETDLETRMHETRSQFQDAIEALGSRDRKRAFKKICNATEMLGEPTWPDGHPAGVALHTANEAHDLVIVNELAEAQEQLREACQLVIAAEYEEGFEQ